MQPRLRPGRSSRSGDTAPQEVPLSRTRDIAGLAAWLALCFVAAAIGGAVTASSVDGWYRTLDRPAWAPPDQVFGPVWTTLFVAMGVAAWRVWRRPDPERGPALAAFGVQLGLNVLWSVLFFGARDPGAALAEIGVLWLAIAVTLALFWRRDRLAGALLVPYLAWVSFAAVLNHAVWSLSR